MIKTKLKSEFVERSPKTEVPTHAYKEREAAFGSFNEHVKQNPEHVAHIMGYMAIGAQLSPEYRSVADAARRVLDTSNNGTQIGFEGASGDRLWGEIFEDREHREVAQAYRNAERKEGASSPAAQELSRLRGLHTLRVYAQQQAIETATNLPNAA